MNAVTRYKDRPLAYQMSDVSIDIETLSRKDNAIVISIGIATHTLGQFYEYFNGEEQMDWARHMEADTLVWHLREHPETYSRDVMRMAKARHTHTVLIKLTEFFAEMHKTPRVWMNSPSFDGKILQSLAHDAGCRLPWEFWQEQDVRTIRTCAELRDADQYAELPPPPDNAHDALVDATYQLEIISRCKVILNC